MQLVVEQKNQNQDCHFSGAPPPPLESSSEWLYPQCDSHKLWVILRYDEGFGKSPQVKETGVRTKEKGARVRFQRGAQGGRHGQQRGLLVTENGEEREGGLRVWCEKVARDLGSAGECRGGEIGLFPFSSTSVYHILAVRRWRGRMLRGVGAARKEREEMAPLLSSQANRPSSLLQLLVSQRVIWAGPPALSKPQFLSHGVIVGIRQETICE